MMKKEELSLTKASVILTLILLLVCVSACQAANPSRTGEKASDIEQDVPEEIRAAMGNGDPTVIFSLKEGMESVKPVGEFDFENHTVLLNSGYAMPIMGLGT